MDSSFNVREKSWMPYDEQEYFTVEKRDTNRLSTCMNDDDYDYAIELRMDDEYRQAADALPNIAEVADVDDDELLVMLDESRRESESKSSIKALPQHRGIVKYIRDSISMHSIRRDSRYSFDDCRVEKSDWVRNVIPSPLQSSDRNDVEEGGISSSNVRLSANRNDLQGDAPTRRVSSPETAAELEDGNYFKHQNSSDSKKDSSTKSSAGWSISSLWGESRNLLGRAASAATVSNRAGVGKEPEPQSDSNISNPVTALFEPVTLLSGKSYSAAKSAGNQSKASLPIGTVDSGKSRM